eukprot:4458670-Pyramimonas_sp.AAC.1
MSRHQTRPPVAFRGLFSGHLESSQIAWAGKLVVLSSFLLHFTLSGSSTSPPGGKKRFTAGAQLLEA